MCCEIRYGFCDFGEVEVRAFASVCMVFVLAYTVEAF